MRLRTLPHGGYRVVEHAFRLADGQFDVGILLIHGFRKKGFRYDFQDGRRGCILPSCSGFLFRNREDLDYFAFDKIRERSYNVTNNF